MTELNTKSNAENGVYRKSCKNISKPWQHYYLQELGIDIWQLREIKKKIMVLIANLTEDQSLSLLAKNLLENILTSTQVERKDFELIFVNDSNVIDNIDLNAYKAIVLMGEGGFYNLFAGREDTSALPIIKFPHPNHLISKPLDKRKAFLSLCELGFKYV